MTKKALGKGLDALIEQDQGESIEKNSVVLIEMGSIIPNRSQPRRHFDEQKLKELASSIRENGIVQPIIVRENDGKYEIIVGERRVKAAKIAGLHEIPAIVKDYAEGKLLELALIENVQREDLDPIEEGLAYKTIIMRDTITQEELAKRVGKSRSYIANMMRLIELPDEIKENVSRGTISVGHAKLLLGIHGIDEQVTLGRRVIKEHLSVRELEMLLKKKKNVPRGTSLGGDHIREKSEVTPYIQQLQERLIRNLGTRVRVVYHEGRGTIMISYYSDEELEGLVSLLCSRI